MLGQGLELGFAQKISVIPPELRTAEKNIGQCSLRKGRFVYLPGQLPSAPPRLSHRTRMIKGLAITIRILVCCMPRTSRWQASPIRRNKQKLYCRLFLVVRKAYGCSCWVEKLGSSVCERYGQLFVEATCACRDFSSFIWSSPQSSFAGAEKICLTDGRSRSNFCSRMTGF